ncbi:MAG TPA: hypothetical protein VHG08_22380 [Longimicrobium sp.]|nr:hypothetical protein [Longimicrobium sp.]
MRTSLGILALAVLACALPASAEAQCNEECVRLVKTDGSHAGYGCIESADSRRTCTATSTSCTTTACSSALLYTPEGVFAGRLDGCADAAAESVRNAGRAAGQHGRLTAAIMRQALLRTLALRQTRLETT